MRGQKDQLQAANEISAAHDQETPAAKRLTDHIPHCRALFGRSRHAIDVCCLPFIDDGAEMDIALERVANR